MKTNAVKIEKEQFNTRIPSDLKRGTRMVAAALDWKVEEIAEVAFACLFGSKDRLIQAKRQKVAESAKSLGLSFNAPDRQLGGLSFSV